jgi:electron transfer flavoprotein alpha/beta subunit
MLVLDIIVCIKPVPDPKQWGKLKLDPETMLLRRGEIPAVLNPLDRNAIERAVALKEQCGATVTAITMAPPDAEDQLAEAVAMGCDRACLLSDKAFAGADTLATARVLAAAIARLPRFDLVFCGGYSLDGSTSNVGPQIAELLGIPDLSHAVSVDLAGGVLRTRCQVEGGDAEFECELPALVTFDREANTPRLPTMTGIMRAGRAGVTRLSAADLGLAMETVGLKGSPTQMLNVFTPPVGRKGEMLQGTPNEQARTLLVRLRRDRVLK